FLATGLRFMPIARGIMNIPATAVWLVGMIKRPVFHHDDDEAEVHEYEDDDEGAYHLEDDAPQRESMAATRLAERQKSRVQRDTRVAAPAKRADKQPALNLASGEY